MKIGDWVRFYQAGSLVIAKVEYVRREERWPHRTEVCTDRGVTYEDDILEARSTTEEQTWPRP